MTLWPSLARSPATVSPAGPAPMTAAFFPVGGGRGGIFREPLPRSKSAAKRSRLPMATEIPVAFLSVQTSSHWDSCGQTRPQMAGSEFVSLSFQAASRKSPGLDELDEARDVDGHGAAGDALGIGAVEAAPGLLLGHLRRQAEVDLLEIAVADIRRAFRHLLAGALHPLL